MRIASFDVDHLRLKSGLYVSRKDLVGSEVVTTFDLRMKRPYREDVMDTGSIHALEHICAAYMRNDPLWGDKIIYFGPMGCRTGFYLVVAGDLESEDILPLVERTFDFAGDFEGKYRAPRRLNAAIAWTWIWKGRKPTPRCTIICLSPPKGKISTTPKRQRKSAPKSDKA